MKLLGILGVGLAALACAETKPAARNFTKDVAPILRHAARAATGRAKPRPCRSDLSAGAALGKSHQRGRAC